jgi:hypothetical protein
MGFRRSGARSAHRAQARRFGPRWFLVDLVGVAGTIALLRYRSPTSRLLLRILSAFALFYAFGWIWSRLIVDFGPREATAFWPTLFLFG